MKSLIAAAALALACTGAFAKDLSEADVPQAVQSGLTQTFAGARVHEWDYKKDDGLFKAEFRVGDKEGKAYLTPEGKVVKSKIDVAPEGIPAKVREAALKDFPGAALLGAHRRVKDDRVTWAVSLRLANGRHKNPVYNEAGFRLD